MFIYIFENGLVQQHEDGPTAEDIRCIEGGILQVLWLGTSDGTIANVVSDDGGRSYTCEALETCEIVAVGEDDPQRECHAPV